MRDEGDQPTARTSHREDQPATADDDLVCERCGDERDPSNNRFCSRACYDDWRHEDWEPKPKPMTLDEMQAEMDAVVERLQTYPEEETS